MDQEMHDRTWKSLVRQRKGEDMTGSAMEMHGKGLTGTGNDMISNEGLTTKTKGRNETRY